MDADGVTGASVAAVSGSGAEYVVTVSTGAGSGTIGLRVRDGAEIADGAGNALGEGFSGGEVFTLNRRPERVVTDFYTEGHGDTGIGYADGRWDLHVHPDALDGDFAPDEILIYGGPDGLRDTPQGPQWAFLGAAPGAQSYLWSQSGTPGCRNSASAARGSPAARSPVTRTPTRG